MEEIKTPTDSERARIDRGFPQPMFGAKRYLHDLLILFEFESVILEMQTKMFQLKEKGADEKVISEGAARIDRLLKCFEGFDSLYTQANYYGQKVLKLEKEKLEAYDKLIEQQKEIEKLNKIIDGNN